MSDLACYRQLRSKLAENATLRQRPFFRLRLLLCLPPSLSGAYQRGGWPCIRFASSMLLRSASMEGYFVSFRRSMYSSGVD